MPFSSIGFSRREMAKLGMLVLVTSFAAAFAIPLEMASLPAPPPSEFSMFRFRLRIEEAIQRYREDVAKLSKKEFPKVEPALREVCENRIVHPVNDHLQQLHASDVSRREAAVAWRWLLFSRFGCALTILIGFVIVPWRRRQMTAASLIPVAVSMATLAWSLDAGARTALLLASVWGVAACVGKIFHDNRRLRLKRPSWARACRGLALVLALLLPILVACYLLGNRIERWLADGVFATEAILTLGIDAGREAVEDAAEVRDRWWHPREWLINRHVRRGANDLGRPAIESLSVGVRTFYSVLGSLYRFLQYVALVSFSWLVLRTLLFACTRSFLYGGGAFVFQLPPDSPTARVT